VLSVARAFAATRLKTVGEIWFVGTVARRVGHLRACGRSFGTMRASTGSSRSTAATWDGYDRCDRAGASRDLQRTGRHSFGAFGLRARCTHGRAIAKIATCAPRRTRRRPSTSSGKGRHGRDGDRGRCRDGHRRAVEFRRGAAGVAALCSQFWSSLRATRTPAELRSAWHRIENIGDRRAGAQSRSCDRACGSRRARFTRHHDIRMAPARRLQHPISLGIPRSPCPAAQAAAIIR